MANIEKVESDICGVFWTRFDEMLDGIENAGYIVEYATEEYIEVIEYDPDPEEDIDRYLLYIAQSGRTMWIHKVVKA